MLPRLTASLRSLALVLFLAGIAAPGAAQAASSFTNGSYTTALLISQASTRIPSAGGTLKVNANSRFTKFILNGSINNTPFKQTITLGKGGKATISPFLPGFSTQSASGTYRARGKRATITARLVNGGTIQMKIESTTYGSALSITSRIVQPGNPDIFVTIIGG